MRHSGGKCTKAHTHKNFRVLFSSVFFHAESEYVLSFIIGWILFEISSPLLTPYLRTFFTRQRYKNAHRLKISITLHICIFSCWIRDCARFSYRTNTFRDIVIWIVFSSINSILSLSSRRSRVLRERTIVAWFGDSESDYTVTWSWLGLASPN